VLKCQFRFAVNSWARQSDTRAIQSDEEEVENLPEQYTDICAAESGRKSEPVEISTNSSLVTECGIATYRASFKVEGRPVVTC